MENRESRTGSSGVAVGPVVLGVLIGVGAAAFVDTTLPVALLIGVLVAALVTFLLLAAWRPGRSKGWGGGGDGVGYGGWSGDGGWDGGSDCGGGGDGGGGGGGD